MITQCIYAEKKEITHLKNINHGRKNNLLTDMNFVVFWQNNSVLRKKKYKTLISNLLSLLNVVYRIQMDTDIFPLDNFVCFKNNFKIG